LQENGVPSDFFPRESILLKYYSTGDKDDIDGYMEMPDPASGHKHAFPALFSGTS
jgi:hypothetical protein